MVNKMLAGALPHCSGPLFNAQSFEDRVNVAKELVEKRYQLDRISAFGGAVTAGSSSGDGGSGGGSGGSKAAGKFDRLRLEQLKNDDDYNSTKRQLAIAHSSGDADKAVLICLRGADSFVAAPAWRSRCAHPAAEVAARLAARLGGQGARDICGRQGPGGHHARAPPRAPRILGPPRLQGARHRP